MTIKPSSINGLGLHATTSWRAGVFLGETHVWHDKTHGWIRTPLGGFINHSNTPNCFIHSDLGIRNLYIIRPIKEEEELTVYYTVGYDDRI